MIVQYMQNVEKYATIKIFKKGLLSARFKM